jgi:uncharacterized surface protein with fasciclin (FAS1) repeats
VSETHTLRVKSIYLFTYKTQFMKMTIARTSLVLIFVTMLNLSCSSPAAGLLSTLGGNANLSGVTSLLKGAGGLDKLIGKDPFTLLAPSNDALKSLGPDALTNLLKPENKDQLTGLLNKHIIKGKVTPEQINAGGLKNAAGNPINLGDSKITQSIPTKNGTIQVIDKLFN